MNITCIDYISTYKDSITTCNAPSAPSQGLQRRRGMGESTQSGFSTSSGSTYVSCTYYITTYMTGLYPEDDVYYMYIPYITHVTPHQGQRGRRREMEESTRSDSSTFSVSSRFLSSIREPRSSGLEFRVWGLAL